MKNKLTNLLKAVGITTVSIACGVAIARLFAWIVQAMGLSPILGLGIALFLLLTFVNYLLIKD